MVETEGRIWHKTYQQMRNEKQKARDQTPRKWQSLNVVKGFSKLLSLVNIWLSLSELLVCVFFARMHLYVNLVCVDSSHGEVAPLDQSKFWL